MQIQMRDPTQLKPYSKNSRKHSAEQIQRVINSIREFGFTNPVLINNDDMIVAGHARTTAAIKMGLTEVPTLQLSMLTPAQIRAYVVADNRLAELSEWDNEILCEELKEIALDFDLELVGFEDFKFDDIDETTEDDFEIPEKIETDIVSGDLIEIGSHRLVCGDSTNPSHVDLVLNKKEPYLMVTDPPYGVEYDASWRNESARHSAGMGNRKIGAGALGKVANDDNADWTETWSLSPAKVAYVWHAGKFSGVVQKSLEDCDLNIRSQIIWAKNHFAISRGDYHWQHEPCWYAVKKGSVGNWASDRKQSTLWEIDKPQKSETGHSTQKPVECMARPIRNHDGDVYDPFCGSGTTMVAAEQLGRKCYAIELSPEYCQIIVDRMLKLNPLLKILINGIEYNPANRIKT